MREGELIGGRFTIQRHAATGGMGRVFRALDRETGQLAAIKVVPAAGPQASERFAREARALAELRHPGIVAYLADGRTAGGDLFLAMEWLDGEDLSARLAASELSLAETLVLGRRVAAALGAAHARGVVHRDVKPSNLFLVDFRPELTKLLDFGIARLAGDTPLTPSSLRLGTPLYMAPEQARGGRDVDARCDVFSLGCVLFRCLTGRPAFPGVTMAELMEQLVSSDEAPRVASLLPGAPAAVDALVARMLRKDPAERPGDASEVLRALVELDVSQPPTAGSPPPRPPLGPAGMGLATGDLVAGRYRVTAFVARGGMGAVFRADDMVLGGTVALKAILTEDARSRARFLREINLARKVSHPSVCRIFDVVAHETEGREVPLLSMELLPGETLAQRLRRDGRMTPAQALPIALQVIAGLAAAHAAGVIHRDLKPQNVMLVPGRGAVITDFGLARVADEPGASSDSGNLAGTPQYLAPEQVEGGAATRASDVYALGLLLYEMVTGRPTFQGDTPLLVAVRRLSHAPDPPRALVPELDAHWEAAILRCLARAPEARPTLDELEEALRGPGAGPGRSRSPLAWVAALLLGAAGLGAGALWLGRRPAAVAVSAPVPDAAEMPPPPAGGSPEDEALAHYRRGEVAAAQRALEDAVARAPESPHARVLLGMVLLEEGLAERATVELALARKAPGEPSREDGELLAALEDMAAGRFDGAADRLTALYGRRPSLEIAVAGLQALMRAGRWASAEALLHAAYALPGVDADHPLLGYLRGLLLSRRGDFAGACDVLARAADEADRRRYPVLAAKSRTLVAAAQLSLFAFGEVIQACDSSRKILADAGERGALIATLDNLSYALYYRGEHGRALRMLDEAIELGRLSGVRTFAPQVSRSINLFLSGKHAEARALQDALAQEAAGDASLLMARAWERAHAGDASAALELLARVPAADGLDARRNDCYVAVVRGQALIAAGSVAEARRVLDAGLDLALSIRFAPLAAMARWLVAWATLEEGNLAEAQAVATQAEEELDRMEMRDYQARVRLLLARIADARGEPARARALREEARVGAAASEDPAVRIAAALAPSSPPPDRAALEALLATARGAGLDGGALEVEVALGALELAAPETAPAGRRRLARCAAEARRLGQTPVLGRVERLLAPR